MKNFTITLSILFLSMSIQAQEISLSGKIVSNTQQPLEFVNVLLLNAVDSSLVKGNVTDGNGHYFLKNIPPDNYLLSVMMVGYQKQYIPRTIKADETNFKQKDIILMKTTRCNCLIVSAFSDRV